MFPNQLIIPQDILETIVHCLHIKDDKTTLHSLALSSKALLIPVQKRIFKRILLDPKPQNGLGEYDAGVIPGVVMRLRDVLARNTRLIPYIQIIQLCQRQQLIRPPQVETSDVEAGDENDTQNVVIQSPVWSHTNWIVDSGGTLAEVLDLIVPESIQGHTDTAQLWQPRARIRQLTISNATHSLKTFPDWNKFPLGLQNALQRIFRLSTLEVVVLNHVGGFPRDLFLNRDPPDHLGYGCGGLRRLELSGVTFAPEHATEDPHAQAEEEEEGYMPIPPNPESQRDGGIPVTVSVVPTPTPNPSQPHQIKYLALTPLLKVSAFKFVYQAAVLQPSFGIDLDELEDMFLGLPTSIPVPSILGSVLNRENGYQRLRKLYIDFKFHIQTSSIDPVWNFWCFARHSKYPLLERISFEGTSMRDMTHNHLEFQWMTEIIPFVEAYTSLYLTATSDVDSYPIPALRNLTLVVLLMSNETGMLTSEILKTLSDRLHNLHTAAVAYHTRAYLHDSESTKRTNLNLKAPLKLRVELKCAFGRGIPNEIVPFDKDEMARTSDEWWSVFKWAREAAMRDGPGGGEYPLEIEVIPCYGARVYSPRN